MTTKSFLQTTFVCGALTCMSLQGCSDKKTMPQVEISSIHSDTVVYLKPGNKTSPSCHVEINFAYLKPRAEEDSLSQQINKQLQRITFGTNYMTNKPEEAVSAFKNRNCSTYVKETTSFYEADLKDGVEPERMTSWYTYEYNISSEIKTSLDSILNYNVTNYEYTGGAHPNTYSTWANINSHTGKVITKSEIFANGTDQEIIGLITKYLLKEVNFRLETDTIKSVQDLWDNGILLDVDLYVPENFLIEEDGVRFLYNRYDIAPYVMGDFQLKIPYTEIKKLMKMK